MTKLEGHFEFELVQRGIVVASVIGPDKERAFAEIMHYAQQYAQDGACIVREGNCDVEIEPQELDAIASDIHQSVHKIAAE